MKQKPPAHVFFFRPAPPRPARLPSSPAPAPRLRSHGEGLARQLRAAEVQHLSPSGPGSSAGRRLGCRLNKTGIPKMGCPIGKWKQGNQNLRRKKQRNPKWVARSVSEMDQDLRCAPLGLPQPGETALRRTAKAKSGCGRGSKLNDRRGKPQVLVSLFPRTDRATHFGSSSGFLSHSHVSTGSSLHSCKLVWDPTDPERGSCRFFDQPFCLTHKQKLRPVVPFSSPKPVFLD